MAENYSVKAVLSADDKNFSSTFKKAMGTTQSLGATIKGTALGMAAFKVAGKAVNMLTSNLDSAISRYDTMNQFPKVMKNLGIGTDQSSKSVKRLSKELTGLPTTLDAAASGVTNFTSKNGDINKSTDYFLALNNAILAGGQSTGIQQSALEQLSQSYAKGKMDMMEWRSIQTAMPAQLKQVATAMGMSTDKLGEGLRNGTISMDSFMDAIVKLNKEGVEGFASFEEQARSATGGIKTAMTNIKTSVTRGIAGVIGSFDELLASNGLPKLGEMANNLSSVIGTAFTNISNYISELDLAGFISMAQPYWEAFSTTVGVVAESVGTALSTIGEALMAFLSNQSTLDTFKTIMEGVGSAFEFAANIISSNSELIASAIPIVMGLVIAFKAFKIIKTVVPFVGTFASALGGLASKGISSLAGKLFGVAIGQKAVGTASSASVGQVMASAFAMIALGAGVALAAAGLTLLVNSAIQLASAGPVAIGVLVGLVAVLALLAVGASVLGPALTAGAVGFIAFGAAIALVGVGALLAATALTLVAGVLPTVVEYGASGAVAIAQLGLGMIAFAGGAALAGAACVVLGVGLVAVALGLTLVGVGVIVVAAGMALLAAGTLVLGVGLTLVAASATVLAGVLPALVAGAMASAAGLLMMMGAAVALGAGLIVLSASMVALVAASAVGAAGIAIFGAAMLLATAGVAAMVIAIKAVNSNMKSISKSASSANASITSMKGSLDIVNSGLDALGSKVKSAMNTFVNTIENTNGKAKSAATSLANGFNSSLQSGLSKSKSVASSAASSIISALNSASSGAYSSGYYIGVGLANGMSATLGMVRSVAYQLAAAAEAAVVAKAKIGSPSRVFKGLGIWIGKGFSNGIEDMQGLVKRTSEKLVNIPSMISGPEPTLALATDGGSMSLDDKYSYTNSGTYTIVVPVEVDGREVARVTAPYNQTELDKISERTRRMTGRG